MRIDHTAADLAREFKSEGVILTVEGNSNVQVTGLSAVESCGPGDLTFADKPDYIETLVTRRPSAVVISPKMQAAVETALKDRLGDRPDVALLIAPNVALAHALLKSRYAGRDYAESGWEGVHPAAVVHATAFIGEGATVEPTAVVGKGARIGAGARIMAGAVIEHDAEIGEGTVVHPGAVVGYRCRVGKDGSIGAGSVLGSEGYGFAQDAKRRSHPIPQTGVVVLEDRVRVGAGCCIDRAAYRETRIGAGTKLDNLCHVAHNVVIGEDCLLTAMFCVAGSTKIGNRVIASGQTGVLDHVEICDDVVLLHRAGVNKSIDKPGVYASAPLQPIADYMKNTATLRSLADMRKRLAKLERELGGGDQAAAGSNAGAQP